jgi:glycosyltransferase involved in cell wall biosynthesis
MTDARSNLVRTVVVAPTYNNARTLGGVIERLSDELRLPVIVVDDGCDDGSAAILARWSAGGRDRWLITHPQNLGKAAALRSGFDRAGALEYSHALTIDTDGQHDVTDVPALLRLAQERPDALIVGARSTCIDGYPPLSRFGRFVSNLFVRIESGARVSDSACGLRVYPLEAVRRVNARSRRFGFELEVITRLAWAGVPIVDAPVKCTYHVNGGRITHFRPVWDSIDALLLHVWLTTRSMIPWPVKKVPLAAPDAIQSPQTGTIVARLGRWMNPMRVWRQVRHDARERRRLASSMAAGMLLATLPPLGFKTVVALLIAKWLRLQPLVVLAVSSLNTPPVGPILAAAGIATGHVVLHGKFPKLESYSFAKHGTWETLKTIGIEWAVGSAVVGTALAVLVYVVVRALLLLMPLSKPPNSEGEHASGPLAPYSGRGLG